VQYQTFRGADLREALGRVKAVLGPDAVIESTRQVSNGRGGGLAQSFVEVTAGSAEAKSARWSRGADPGVTAATVSAPTPRRTRLDTRTAMNDHPTQPRKPTQEGPTIAWLSGLSQKELDRELRSLRGMLEELSSSRPPKERTLALLYEAGFEGRLARELAANSGRALQKGQVSPRSLLLDRLIGRLRVSPGLIAQRQRQLIACVGPTGAGKTTTLAKLAAQAKLDFARSVGIISLDTYRVGAVEQWQRYAQLLGVPFAVARSVHDFEVAVASSTCDLLLVDTTGRSPTEKDSEWLLSDCLPRVTRREVEVLSVLPAWLRARDAEQVIATYSDISLTGAVITKLDETVHHGGVVQGVIVHNLPVKYTCNGPRVPEDIHDASAEALLSNLLRNDS
jgi:flagellar biosynthesis protein FlhF